MIVYKSRRFAVRRYQYEECVGGGGESSLFALADL